MDRTLSDRLQSLMDSSGASQADLARACGVSRASVSDWLSGKSQGMKAESLVRAAAFFSVTEKWLATGMGRKERDGVAKLPPAGYADEGDEAKPDLPMAFILQHAPSEERRATLDRIRMSVLKGRSRYLPEQFSRMLDAIDELEQQLAEAPQGRPEAAN